MTAYFFLRGFAFFLAISSRVLTGMASIRRASSSRGIAGVSSGFRDRALVMVRFCHG